MSAPRGLAFVAVVVATIVVRAHAAYAQSVDAGSTWVGAAFSGEQVRFSHSGLEPGISDIEGTQPTLSLRVSRLATRHVGVGVDLDISRGHERVRHVPLTAYSDGRSQTQTFDDILTLRERFTTATAHLDYSTPELRRWTTTFSVGVSFTRLRHSSSHAFVPPLPFPPPGFTQPTRDVRIAVGPTVGLEVRRALGERWSMFGDFRLMELSGYYSPYCASSRCEGGFLLRPGFGIRARL